MENQTINDLTPEEIALVLKARKGNEKTAYEQLREDSIQKCVSKFHELEKQVIEAKKEIFDEMIAFVQTSNDYGKVPKDTQKNHTLTSKDGRFQVKYNFQITKGFDERAKSAEVLLKRFIENYISEKAPEFVGLIQALLERNKKGDYDINLMNRLYAMENQFEHEDWKNAIALFKESYVERKTASYVNAYEIDSVGRYQLINVNFSSSVI